jgi:hypothetical protein
MNRREALKAATAVLGGAALVGSTGVLLACGREREAEPRAAGADDAPARVLGASDQQLVEEIADTLLPTTAASPGAKAAGAGAAINLLLSDCYDAAAHQRVLRGLSEFRAACAERAGGAFTSLPAAERARLLREVDAEAQRVGEAHYFGLVRELALRAYFSSEVGMTQALRYVRTPGRWTGCVPLVPGQPAWG